MKMTFAFPESLKDSEIIITAKQGDPVLFNYEGEAIGILDHISKEKGAIIDITDESIVNSLMKHYICGVGGRIVYQDDGKTVQEMQIYEVSLVSKYPKGTPK